MARRNTNVTDIVSATCGGRADTDVELAVPELGTSFLAKRVEPSRAVEIDVVGVE